MPRASQYLLSGYTYHLTHRCTNRQFLLRFAKDRDAYREWLRVGTQRHHVPLYGYCITGNHVHLIVHVDDVESVGAFMDLVAGATAQAFNRRKNRTGAFWEPYHCTIVQDGNHLFNCLRYIDLNMVRAGVVSSPGEWPWSSWDELTGTRLRYRIVNMDRLLQSLDMSSIDDFRANYVETVRHSLLSGDRRRETIWTESLVVGSRDFVSSTSSRFVARRRFDYTESTSSGAWAVRETAPSYVPVSTAKTRPNDL